MSQIEFEPFGERVRATGSPKTPSLVERRLLKAGAWTFWVLVAGIVTARAFFFNPDYAQVFSAVAQISSHLRSAFHG